MKTKTHTKLILSFAGIVFCVLLATMTVMFVVGVFLYRMGIFTAGQRSPVFPALMLMFVCILIGTGISLFVGSKMIKPITKLSKALSEVTEGNFGTRIEEKGSIEEIRDMAKNFNSMARSLSSIETLRNDFIVNVSHEFKTPIASIEGYVTLLQNEDLSAAERNEYIGMILESSGQLSTLSGNILNLSKLESQETLLNKKEFRLDEQIRQAVLLLEKEWSSKDLHIHVDLSKITYNGDEALLMQVWTNLIGNAIKFTGPGGSIRIGSFVRGARAAVEISDSGCGISEGALETIFDKFYQEDTARKSEGNGLGLTLAKRIVDLCGGTITVKSRIGKGSTFTVSLPL